MAIESGYSESKAKLAADARWWLAESQGDVAIAITISVHKTRREITIDLWGVVARPTRADPARKVPAVEHRVVLSQGGKQHHSLNTESTWPEEEEQEGPL